MTRHTSRLAAVVTIAAALVPAAARAVTVDPVAHLVSQPDGTTLEVYPHGDEFNVFWELASGHTVVRDEKGWWRFATLDEDGRLVPREGLLAGAASGAAGVPRHLRPRRLGGGAGELSAVPFGARLPVARSVAAGSEQQPLLVILVEFTDRVPVGATAAQFREQFFTGERSVRAYFDANTFGALDIVAAGETHGVASDGIVGWLPLALNHPNRGITGSKSATQTEKNQALHDTRLVIKAAIEAADPYVDFAAYDLDADGALSTSELAVTVIMAGYEASYGGYSTTYSPADWGHRWSLGFSDAIGYVGPALVDGVEVAGSGSAGGYTTFGEWMQSSASNGHRASVGIMAHELGHDILRLPDLYDTDSSNGESAGLGAWCLMAGGSWGSEGGSQYSGDVPTGLSGWSKLVTGVVRPVELAGSGTATATPAANTPNVFRIGSGAGNEYFLLEYRSPVGFDAGLKRWDSAFSAGGGLLVLHVDEHVEGNDDVAHKRVDVEEANAGVLGYSLLDLDDDDAERAMLYYAGNVDRFADDTDPSAARYDAGASGVVVSLVGAAETGGIAFSYTAPNPSGYAADSCGTALDVTLAPGESRAIAEDPSQAGTSRLPRLCTAVSGTAWYRVTPQRSGLLTVETSGYDTVAAVVSGGCGAPLVVACNDDGVAAGGGSRIKDLPVRRGEPVHVVVGRWATSVAGTLTGSFALSPGAPLQVTAVTSAGCPRSRLDLLVSGNGGPVSGLTADRFTAYVDGVEAMLHDFDESGAGRYTFELWLDGGAAAVHPVRIEVDGDGTAGDLDLSLTEQGTACVGITAPTETLIIPMAAHLPGSNGTNWRTDVATSVLGAAGAALDVDIAYLEHASANSDPVRSVFAAPAGGDSLPDVAASSFGVSSGKGALVVRWQRGAGDSTSRLFVASRTYNLLGAGNPLGLPAGSSFGQAVQGTRPSEAIQPGATAWITGLVQKSGVARSNVGLLAAGDAGASVTLDFSGPTGTQLLTRAVTLRTWEYVQLDKVLQAVAGGVDAASVRIGVAAGSSPVVAYVSVVDDVTGDPVTLLPAAAARTEWFVPMAANLTGLADTNWRSDVSLLNPGVGAVSVVITFLQENRDNSGASSAAPIVLPGQGCTRISDVVKTVFGRSGVKGALRITADGPVVVASRTYNLLLAGNSLGLPAGATFGQGVAGVASNIDTVDSAHPGTIAGVVRNSSFRSNLGLLDTSGLGVTVSVNFRGAGNEALGTSIARVLRPFEYVQVNNVLAAANVSGDVTGATAVITVSGGGAAAAYLSVVEELTGDPVTVAAQR